MKIIFAGTPAFAVEALGALIDSHHEILAVYTQPDRPKGRGLKLTASPVKQLALAHHLVVRQPASLKSIEAQDALRALDADLMVVAAYGLLLPKAVLDIPKYGCINIHPSALPRWRGAAPIQHTILSGDQETAVAIMQMDEGLDTGDILLEVPYTLRVDETSESLHDVMATKGAALLLEAIKGIEQGSIRATAQAETGITYAHKLNKADAKLDWSQSLDELDRKIRGYNPWPVAFIDWQGQVMKLWQAEPLHVTHQAKAGEIIAVSPNGIDIAVNGGILRLLKVQLPGAKAVSIADFYNAHKDVLIVGNQFA